MRFPGPEFYLKSPDEMAALFKEVPEALSNTLLDQRDGQPVDHACPGRCCRSSRFRRSIRAVRRRPGRAGGRRGSGPSSPAWTTRTICQPNPRYGTGADRGPGAGAVGRALAAALATPVTRYFICASYRGPRAALPATATPGQRDAAGLRAGDHHPHGLRRATSSSSRTSSTGPRTTASPSGPGRGSGAGSIVAYSLRITDIEPLQLRPPLRALPQPRARVDAGLRRGLLLRAAAARSSTT
ncbi:MAG: hypothetical protein MZW92_16875 [Comamonadaceae bacterium]|nr:hypothetical protein [Comamonadaceae bacterium]